MTLHTFSATSDAPYERHNYRLVLQNGQSIVYGSWEETQAMWWQGGANTFSHVEVLDRVAPKAPKKVKRAPKGF